MIIRIIAVAVSFCVAGVGYLYWSYADLPHPSQASHKQLSYWLVLRDLETEPHDLQIALVERLVNDADVISAGGDNAVRLTDRQTENLRNNLERLKYVWFQDRVKRYHRAAAGQKWSFLESQIDVVGCWASITMQHADVLYPDTPRDQDYSAMMFDEVEWWLEKTPQVDHPAAYQAVSDAIVCWLGTDSLQQQTPQARLELASRIARELDSGTEIGAALDFVPDSCLDRMAGNVELLVEAWLLEAAEKFDGLPNHDEKNRFVDELIESVNRWGVLKMLGADSTQSLAQVSGSAGQDPTSADLLALSKGLKHFSGLADSWSERANPQNGRKLKRLTDRIQQRVFASILRRN